MKIDPASIGVGLYQHDARAKHLRDTLDDVVQICVSFVGVELNSASAPLLRYVSGMNQLTARRVYEHRQQNGPFKSRQQLMEVSGFGERDVRPGGRLPQDRQRRRSARRDLDSPRKLRRRRKLLAKLGVEPASSRRAGTADRIRELVAPLDRAAARRRSSASASSPSTT